MSLKNELQEVRICCHRCCAAWCSVSAYSTRDSSREDSRARTWGGTQHSTGEISFLICCKQVVIVWASVQEECDVGVMNFSLAFTTFVLGVNLLHLGPITNCLNYSSVFGIENSPEINHSSTIWWWSENVWFFCPLSRTTLANDCQKTESHFTGCWFVISSMHKCLSCHNLPIHLGLDQPSIYHVIFHKEDFIELIQYYVHVCVLQLVTVFYSKMGVRTTGIEMGNFHMSEPVGHRGWCIWTFLLQVLDVVLSRVTWRLCMTVMKIGWYVELTSLGMHHLPIKYWYILLCVLSL